MAPGAVQHARILQPDDNIATRLIVAANWCLPFSMLPVFFGVMIPLLRFFAILLTVLAFSVTSTGWGIASGMKASGGGKGHHATIETDHSAGSHAHGNSDLAQGHGCHDGASSGCGPDDQSGDTSSSCCAISCHTAIESAGCTTTLIAIVRTIDHPLIETSVRGSSSTRLERPPRPADL